MKSLHGRILLSGAILWLMAPGAVSQEFDLRGQFSSWVAASKAHSFAIQLGLRYIPTFSLKKPFPGNRMLDLEVSINSYGSVLGTSPDDVLTSGKIKPYRIWLRWSTSQFEARVGLQKLNFGSALLLRPLMWFDRIDPNDPLQLTDGVYGLLLRYTFLGNSNIWLWGLYGNADPKGWETIPTQKKSPEYGGRYQFPLLRGELALSYHHRRMDPGRSLLPLPSPESHPVPENRFGLDGKWDLGVGVWFEGVLSRQDFETFPLRYQKNINLGLDYTFGVGRGLHVLGEHLVMQASTRTFVKGETNEFSALALDYPFGLTDQIKGMLFYNWKTTDWYRFVSWQRMSDHWSFYVIGFWNPSSHQIFPSQQGKSLFAGKGFEVMIVFNH